MTKFHIVTSFSDKLWNSYAGKTVPTVYNNKPKNVPMTVWFNGEFKDEWKSEIPDVAFEDLNAVSDYQYFRKRYKGHPTPKVEPGHQFRYNFLPFWNKVCAIYQHAVSQQEGYLVWVDADVLSAKEITLEDLVRWTEDYDVSTLVRGKPWNTWDSGFLAFKLPESFDFIKSVYSLYTSGRIFDHAEWHDAYLFTVMYKEFKENLTLKNLNMMSSAAHPFDSSILPPQLAHLKGGERKHKGLWLDPSKLNGVFTSEWTGVRNVKDDVPIKLTETGNFVFPDGEIRNAF